MTAQRAERLAWIALLAAAIVLRFVALGDRPVHHDESQHGYYAWLLVQTGAYSYSPVLHGPLDFFAIGSSFALFGDGEFTLRLPHALCGSLLCLTPLLLRRELGRGGALATGVLLCFSPTLLYYSRFAREDIIIALLTAIAFAALIRLGYAPRRRHAIVLLAALALSFAAKESTFITCFALAVAVGAVAALQRRRGTPLRDAWPLHGALAVGRESWQYAIAMFVALITLLFSNGLTNPSGLVAGIADGLSYWLGQHSVGRGDQPVTFYLILLALYETAVVVLAIVGAIARRREPWVQLLSAYALVTLAVYSWAGEKFGWLVIHTLLPAAFLAGAGATHLWARRATLRPRLAIAAAVLLVGAGAANALRTSFDRSAADPRELFISPQTSVAASDAVLALRSHDKSSAPLTYAIDDTIQWPWTWYLRGRDFHYATPAFPRSVIDVDVAILFDPTAAALTPQLAPLRRRMFPFRPSWVVDYARATPRSVARWLVLREPWSPTGGDRVWIYSRRSLGTGR